MNLALLLFAVLQAPCPTTLDGLPMCPRVEMSAAECLDVFTPDEAGGFCEWYGYATKAEADRFERRRGFVRRGHDVGSSGYTLWQPITPRAREVVACRERVMRNTDWRQPLDFKAACEGRKRATPVR